MRFCKLFIQTACNLFARFEHLWYNQIMLKFSKEKLVKRYVAFKDGEPIAAFTDKTDALAYSQDNSFDSLDEVDCIKALPYPYLDSPEKDYALVRIQLFKKPSSPNERHYDELWCAGSFADAAVYAYAYHVVAKGQKKENLQFKLTEIEYFSIVFPNSKLRIEEARSSPMIEQILSHVDKNNFQLSRSLLNECFNYGYYTPEALRRVERLKFTFDGEYLDDVEEQVEYAYRTARRFLLFEDFSDYGFVLNDFCRDGFEDAQTLEEQKAYLVWLYVIRDYEQCFPYFIYEMLINGKCPILPQPKS